MQRVFRLFIITCMLGYIIDGEATAKTKKIRSEIIETESTSGAVVKISDKLIVISEYDIDKGENIEVVYTVAEDVDISGRGALDEINVGENVIICYTVKAGVKIASNIAITTADADTSDSAPAGE